MWMTTEKVARLFVEEFVSSDNMEMYSPMPNVVG